MGHVSYTEEINATPERIWSVLTEVTRLPEWAYKEGRFPYPVEGRYGTEQQAGVGTIWIGVAADGQMATQKVIEWEPPRRLVYELQEMKQAALQMAQTYSFDLEPLGELTRVTWAVDWHLTGGFSLSSLLIRFSGNGAFEEMMAGSLENLKKLVEQEATQVAESPPAPEVDEPATDPTPDA